MNDEFDNLCFRGEVEQFDSGMPTDFLEAEEMETSMDDINDILGDC